MLFDLYETVALNEKGDNTSLNSAEQTLRPQTLGETECAQASGPVSPSTVVSQAVRVSLILKI